jgi:hypothetical protein
LWQSNEPANNIPDGFNELFWVWVTFPPSSYQLDTKYYAPTIQTCYPSGQKMWTDTVSPSEHMAPYFTFHEHIATENAYHYYSRMDILTISAAIISIMSFLMTAYNEHKKYFKKENNTKTPNTQLEMPVVELNAIITV